VLAAGQRASAVTVDVNDNLYVCTDEGLLIADEYGEPYAQVITPAPASGLCFGGKSLSEMYIAAGDTLWMMRSSTQGVEPKSPRFMRMMDKQAAAGEFRHVGW